MYESFYGFSEPPFSVAPDPMFLYFAKGHKTAWDFLEYSMINRSAISVITGQIGSGKTTLIRHLIGQVDRSISVGLVSNTSASFFELLQSILFSFKLEYKNKQKMEMFHTFVEFLIRDYGRGKHSLLIIDEAQNLSIESLEELRMLSNVNVDKDLLLQIVMVGQTDLRHKLSQPELKHLAQRLAVSHDIQRLDASETEGYINHRIQVAGYKDLRPLFDGQACAVVHQETEGTPRLINILCDAALVYGFGMQKKLIDGNIVAEAARDRRHFGI